MLQEQENQHQPLLHNLMNETTKLSLKLKGGGGGGGEQATHIYDFDIVGGGGVRGDNTLYIFGLKDVRITTFTKFAERVGN